MHNLAYVAALLSTIVAIHAAPNPEMTAAAVLPRQLQTTIVGYYMNGTEVWSTWCNPGYRYCTSSTFGTCGLALATDCNVQVSCVSTSIIVDREGYSQTCSSGTNTVCATNTIFQTPGDRSPVRSLACRGAGSPDASIYRSIPNPNDVTATTSSSYATPSQSSRSATGLTTVASQTGPTTTSSPSATAAPAVNPPAEKSKAWIAGPVIGGLVAIVAIAFGVIFFRRRRSAGRAAAASGQDYNESKPPGYSPTKETYASYATPVYGPAELASPNTKAPGPAELGSSK